MPESEEEYGCVVCGDTGYILLCPVGICEGICIHEAEELPCPVCQGVES